MQPLSAPALCPILRSSLEGSCRDFVNRKAASLQGLGQLCDTTPGSNAGQCAQAGKAVGFSQVRGPHDSDAATFEAAVAADGGMFVTAGVGGLCDAAFGGSEQLGMIGLEGQNIVSLLVEDGLSDVGPADSDGSRPPIPI